MKNFSFIFLGPLALCILIATPLRAAESANDPELGKRLPVMRLPSTDGKEITLPKDFKGKWTLLYFYPKDNSPGCTIQASEYRDNLQGFKKRDIQIYGVSADSITSHKKFINTVNINFPLLADEKFKLSKSLGVYHDDQLSRDTFLIDPKGIIRTVWRQVDPASTTAETYETALRKVKEAKVNEPASP